MVGVPGLRHSRLANVVLGNYFTWSDLIAYTLGIGLTIAVELWRKPKPAARP